MSAGSARHAPESQQVLAAERVTVRFAARPAPVVAVDDVSLAVAEGRCLGIVGQSGSGKSALCRYLAGLPPRPGEHRAGQVLLAGQNTDTMRPRQRRKFLGTTAGLVLQESGTGLNPLMTCGKQLTEHLCLNFGLSRAAAMTRAAELLDMLGLPDVGRVLESYPLQLSGGMRQRVVLAIALSTGPRLLIADEATTGLDVTIQAQVLRLLREQQIERNMALIVVSHDLRVVSYLADEIMVMNSARVVEHGPTEQLLSAPRAAYTAELLAASGVSPAQPADHAGPGPSGQHVTMTAAKTEAPAVVEVSDLSVRYRNRAGATMHAVAGVSYQIAPGECVALVGESGSGKTSTALAMLGLVRRSAGVVRMAGRDTGAMDTVELRQFRREIHLMAQDSRGAFNPKWSVEQVVTEPLRLRRRGAGPPAGWSVERALAEVTLDPALRSRKIRTLSGGQVQRVALARALSLEPRVLVLDEPLASSDVLVQRQLIALFNRIRASHGTAILLISHDLAIVRSIADRVMVMHQGKIVESGPVTSVLDRPEHSYTIELMASSALAREACPVTGVSPAAAQTRELDDEPTPA
jgi:ABC-type glutathione transport system ATPase component